MNPKLLECMKSLKENAELLSKYFDEHPESIGDIVGFLNGKEPKKVSVVDELTEIIYMKSHNREAAIAAIEFFRARMPKSAYYNDDPIDFGYNQAIKDVRRSLFGEE